MRNSNQTEVEEYIGDKKIPIEEFISEFFSNEVCYLDDGEEYFGYIARWSEKEPYWALFMQVESKGKVLGTSGSCNFGSSENYMDIEDFLKILDIFTKQGKKVIVDTHGYFDNQVTNRNQIEDIDEAIGDKTIPLEEFVNTVIEDIGFLKDGEEIIGCISRWHKNDTNWAFLIRVDRQGASTGIAGHFEFGGKRELKEVIHVFNLFANKGLKIIVNTDGYLVD